MTIGREYAELSLTEARQRVRSNTDLIKSLWEDSGTEGINQLARKVANESAPDDWEELCDFLIHGLISGVMPDDPDGYITIMDVIKEQVRDLLLETARSEAYTITTERGTLLTQNERAYLYENMTRYGGGFAKAMAEALVRADPENERRLLDAFPELFRAYRFVYPHLKLDDEVSEPKKREDF